MSKESYRLPVSPTDCFDFMNNTLTYCVPNAVAWSIPDDVIKDLQTKGVNYSKNYAIANNRQTQSPAATVARDASWSIVKPPLVDLYNDYLINNDAISAADKQALNIYTVNNGGSAPIPAPVTTPTVTLTAIQIAVLKVLFTDSDTPGSHAKPNGISFCELWYKIDGAAPASPDECPDSCYISRSGSTMVFEPTQRGKTIYVYARWVTRTGKTGQWSAQFSAIIP